MGRSFAIAAVLVMALNAQRFTRGVGVYPGDPKEDFSPALKPAPPVYRNLALRRPAYHSSGHDYNLAAQLVTDGIRETKAPQWMVVSTSQHGVLKKHQREWILDRNWVSAVDLRGKSVWVEIEYGGWAPMVEGVEVDASVRAAQPDNQEWTCVVLGSEDGQGWKELGQTSGMARPSGEIHTRVRLKARSQSRLYRVQFESGRTLLWQVGEVAFLDQDKRVNAGGPYPFNSAWKSEGSGEEWVYVDLGTVSSFDRVDLHWIRRAAEGWLQVSGDAVNWKNVRKLTAGSGTSDTIRLAEAFQGRYVRILMTRPATADGYILSEMEVYGKGGLVAVPKPPQEAGADGRLALAGGTWKLERDSQVNSSGPALSEPGFDDAGWLPATVPGTVLASYVNAGALPDPNYGDNQLMISDSYFHADFWYRQEFTAPRAEAGRRVWLNFDGVNWKAEVFLNGQPVGRIDGGFTRARFDVTALIRQGRRNALAVRAEKNATPGSVKEKTFENPDKNGGALGADNPTYHASIGWDWIPTIRGRNTGIWNDVFLSASGPVTVGDPLVTTVLSPPDLSRASVTVEVPLRNHDARRVSGMLRGRFGDQAFEEAVALEPSSEKTVKQVLELRDPKLWWPAGYGEPNLYRVELRFETADKAAPDVRTFQAGVRQFTYSEEGGALRMWINGRRFIPRGGNWGFSESMLRYRGREYDAAVRYHRDMNFTMIRNWVGQTGDDEFFEACDRHGIVVWQDFWLANPWDGPDPDDNAMFLRNTEDLLMRIRHHPSIGLYCGRNEGYPARPLDEGIRRLLAGLHPDVHYIPSSADDVVSGHGPYRAQGLKQYFSQRATPKFHSEMGMPNIVNMDSLTAMMPAAQMWPLGRMWGLHDFCLEGAQGGASFLERIEKSYGGADNAADWVWLAQWVNYEGYRAMFEAQSKNRMGLLIWMSHPAWPSLVWQTYDYYLEPTAAYFGSKKGSEPLHIQWNPLTEKVEVVNYSAGDVRGLSARVEVLNMDGSLQWEKTVVLDSQEDSVVSPITMEYPAGLSAVHFLRLRLTRGDEMISENFYWRGREEGNFRALRELPKVKLEATTRVERRGSRWLLTTELRNVSASPAMMVRLKAVREASGDRVLPALYSDNYVALMPGERRAVRTELEDADTRGEKPRVVVEGFNVGEVEAQRSDGGNEACSRGFVRFRNAVASATATVPANRTPDLRQVVPAGRRLSR